ncbi:MAG: hypothetical protein K2Q12_06820, partial [Rickettsiales bacterium]|nr:hypothetical protein [Rickettsiales bacterium]
PRTESHQFDFWEGDWNVTDPTGKVVEEIPSVTLNAFGAYDGHFTLPANAAVGWYEFYLTARFENDSEGNPLTFTAQPLSVLVADFTPSPFRVTNTLNADQLVPDQTLEVSTQAQMHAGGPYADAALRVTAILDAKDFTTKENSLNQFIFDSGNDEYSRSEQVFQSVVAVDAKGENLISFAISPERMTNKIAYGALTVESAVQDERGKYVTTSSQLNYSGVDRLVGLYSPDWVLQSGKPASIDVITVGVDGKAVADTPARVTIEKLERKAARVKGAGNAYLATFETEWKPFGTCTITASATPQPCRFTPDAAGSYRAVAQIEDQKNRPHTTTLALWATGGDYVLWDDGNSNSLELVKQSDGLKVGDTARYLVKNPFPGAQALVTVERYGVIDSFTQTLEGSTPIIEIPIKPDYVPGFYVSVTVMAPRAGDKPFGKPGELDLGKPAFRMGYAATEVKDPYKEMRITAKADREVYRPGDTVTLSLHAEPSRAGTKEPIELAVVVLDESVFDLIQGGRNYFDPYKGFYLLDALDLRNFNLITQLIGRQKFEKKGSNAGGDGGAGEAMRSMFKYVSYWNPSLVVDAQGNASAQFKVPDNLTGWRILTLATTPTDRMGLGEGTFKVNRPTELRPVMPNQVMEGDQFKAGFSVMNRTDKARDIEVRLEAEGILSKAGGISKTIHLEPFKREIVWLPLTAGKLPNEIRPKEAMIDFKASAGDATDRDALDYHLNVKKWRSLETAANYGSTTDNHVSESIAFPAAMKPDVGSLSVELSPSVIGNISGAFNYIRDYPYLCWEQRLTKAIAASQFTALHSYLPTDSKWQDSEKIPVQTLTDASSFQAPNGGMAYFLANDDYVDPYLSAYTALGFQWLKEMGHTIPDTVEQSLNAYLQRFLKQDVAPTYYDPGMASTVRAVALAALAEQKKVTLSDLRRYTPHVKQMSLFGQAHYVQAALSLGAPEEEVRPVIDQILSHANQSGGKVTFTETLDDSYVRLLSSPLRENCVILDTLSQYAKTEQGAKQVSDIPLRLVRSITQARGTRDHWENTQENLFCMQALWHYSQTYEAEKPAMKVNASLGTQALGTAAFDDVRDASVTLSHAIDAQDVGRKAQLELSREGDGRLYYATRLQFAPTGDANQPANAGIEVKREYSVEREGIWQKMAAPYTIKRGELVLVDLYISLPAARTFVVVDDPVPGGLEPVNRDLATSSVVDAQKGEYKRSDASWYFHFNDWVNYQDSRWSFYHQELRHDAVRFYADYLPAGHYHLSYTAQAIAEGEFSLLPMKAEEMYDTDIFGKTSAETLKVEGAN